MSQAVFAQCGEELDSGTAAQHRTLTLEVSIFAERAHILQTLESDARAAGFAMRDVLPLEALHTGEGRVLGDVVLVDCPQTSGATLAALVRLDERVARSGAQLVVSTSTEALDDVFGCLERCRPQILVDPSRAERVVALGGVLARGSNLRLRELGEEDRLAVLRLTEQVARIAERLETFAPQGRAPGGKSAFRFASPQPGFRGADGPHELLRKPRPPLPDPRLVRQMIHQRQMRARFFDGELFADPAWDILLDLTAARAEHRRVSVTSLCIASGVPATTALRWIGQMVEAGLLERVEDESDRRRAFIALCDRASDAMAHYFAQLAEEGAVAI